MLAVGGGGGGSLCGGGGGSGFVMVREVAVCPLDVIPVTVGLGDRWQSPFIIEVSAGPSPFGSLVRANKGWSGTPFSGGGGGSAGGGPGVAAGRHGGYGGTGGSNGTKNSPWDYKEFFGQGYFTSLLSRLQRVTFTEGRGGSPSDIATREWCNGGGGGGGVLVN